MNDKIKLEDFFSPVCKKELSFNDKLDIELTVGANIDIYYEGFKFKKDKKYDVGIFSFRIEKSSLQIRKEFYSLSNFNKKTNIIDFGMLKADATSQKNNHGIAEVLPILKKYVNSIVFLSDDKDIIKQVYKSYENTDTLVNINHISPIIAFESNQQDIKPGSLTQTLLNPEHKLFNYVNLGYQIPFNHQKNIDFINTNNFEAYRYSKLYKNIEENEYLLRDGQVTILNMSSIRQADAPEVSTIQNNGFSAFEICQLAYYAGASDNMEVLALLDLIDNYTENSITAKLTAQIIWYYIWGYAHREQDYPALNNTKYKRISVSMDDNTSIVFYKNIYNNRWWFEVDFNKQKIYISCSEEDYTQTIKGFIPERWVKFYNKQ